MSSLITNSSSMVALQTLRGINSQLDETNNRVSTGLRVNSASDNAAYWSIATTTRSDNGALSSVKDALGLGAASVDTANTGLDTVRESLQKIKEKLVTAAAPETDKAKLQTEIKSLLDGIKNTADSSVISGNNWLSVATAGETKDIVVSFSRSGSSITLDTINVDMADYALYEAGTNTGIMDKNRSATTYSSSLSVVATAFDDATDEVEFNVKVGGATTTVSITQATVEAALGTGTTALTNAADFKAVLDQAFKDAGLSDLSITADNTAGTVSIDSAESFELSALTVVTDASTADLDASDFGLATAPTVTTGSTQVAVKDIDITSATTADVQNYLKVVDAALLDLTDASTKAGALTSRIQSQESFVMALMDANDRAIGTLVDADMEEESTRLKALQTQQQLAIQSLSIANSSSQNILSLFRS
ncbi:flagellin [Afifella sp. IM 167]|uniref:flagellin N-terminal helical domain-containing protein n=1 Tax=Afifella sp. IM 167 TaxID=2033586 RepID=UPI001CCFCF62|nr:flagellin [Afifella sp. IM 167]MBZ8131775.1 flagellin [Afifella sp. IM 167]